MQRITVKINNNYSEVEKITGKGMCPHEFLAYMTSATMIELFYKTDMTAEEIFFEITRHATEIVGILNDSLEEDDEEGIDDEMKAIV